MAWPPTALPTNRTNATPQQNTHPGDHNAVNLAVNDTVAKVLAMDSIQSASLALVNARVFPSVTIGSGNIDTGAATMTDWITYGALAVPANAAKALIHVTISGIFAPAAPATTSFSLRVRLNSQNGFAIAGTDAGVTQRFTVTWGEAFNVVSPGTTQTLAIQAIRPAGSYLRFDAACRVTFDVSYLGA